MLAATCPAISAPAPNPKPSNHGGRSPSGSSKRIGEFRKQAYGLIPLCGLGSKFHLRPNLLSYSQYSAVKCPSPNSSTFS